MTRKSSETSLDEKAIEALAKIPGLHQINPEENNYYANYDNIHTALGTILKFSCII